MKLVIGLRGLCCCSRCRFPRLPSMSTPAGRRSGRQRQRELPDVVRAGAAAGFQSRRRAAALVLVRAGDRGIRRRGGEGPLLRDGPLGRGAQPMGQSVCRAPLAAADRARARRHSARAHDGHADAARARVHRRGRRALYERRRLDPARAHRRLRAGHGTGRPGISRRHGGAHLLRARGESDRPGERQEIFTATEGRGHPRTALQGASEAPGARALHHSRLRSPAARGEGARRRAQLRVSCAVGAARAAHAVAYVYARRLVEGIDRDQSPIGRGGAQRERDRRRAARDGLPDVRIPADREGCRCAADDGRGARRLRTAGSQRGRRGRARCCRRVCRSGDSRALRARARRVGRSGVAAGARRARFPTPTPSRTSRARSAPRGRAIPRPLRPMSNSLRRSATR